MALDNETDLSLAEDLREFILSLLSLTAPKMPSFWISICGDIVIGTLLHLN